MHIESHEIDREETPLGPLTLRRYVSAGGEEGYEVLLNGSFLMASHGAHSERAMATLAYERLSPRVASAGGLRVLVGGLGAGHTLRATLDLPSIAEVIVSELGARVVEWNRRYFARWNDGAVLDPRVRVEVGSLAELLRATPQRTYHLMLLDVDNGPGFLAAPGNAWLYTDEGVACCRRGLAPGGVLAVWSPHRNPIFREVFTRVFPAGEELDTTALGKPFGEPGDVIYLARR